MKVNKELIEHVAGLAKLKLTEHEIEKFVPQLDEVFEFISKLKDVDTEGVEPSFQPVEIRNVMREDKEKECLSQDDALSLTDHKKDGYFKGPRAV